MMVRAQAELRREGVAERPISRERIATALRLPSLAWALGSRGIEPMRPSALFPPPEGVLSALESAQQILVIAHVPPDPDTFGAGLGLVRTLRALGKSAQLVCDDSSLSSDLRAL